MEAQGSVTEPKCYKIINSNGLQHTQYAGVHNTSSINTLQVF